MPYRDTITYQEVADAPAGLIREREAALLASSGACNVTSGVLHRYHSIDRDTLELGVSFDSRFWTGRP